MSSQNLAAIYIAEINRVSLFEIGGVTKTRGEKMKVCYAMLLKTNGEKMSDFCLSTMLMKTNKLIHAFHDLTEKKYSYRAVTSDE